MSGQFNLPLSMRPSEKPGWKRYPVGGKQRTGYADYRYGETQVWVRWCGHPTALWKYYVVGVPSLMGRTYRTSKEAKAAVEQAIA